MEIHEWFNSNRLGGMTDIIEITTVNDPLGGCPHCGNGGQIKRNLDGLDWLVCHEHKTRWFLGVGFSAANQDNEQALLNAFEEVQPVYPGHVVHTLYGNVGAKLVELVFRDGTVPNLHEPLNQPLPE